MQPLGHGGLPQLEDHHGTLLGVAPRSRAALSAGIAAYRRYHGSFSAVLPAQGLLAWSIGETRSAFPEP